MDVIEKRVARFCKSHDQRHELIDLMNKAIEGHTLLVKSLNNNIVALIFIWIVTYAISLGLLSEGSIGAFKLAGLESIIPLSPIVFSFKYYTLMGKSIQSSILRDTIGEFYKTLFPAIEEERLWDIVFNKQMLSIEGIMNEYGFSSARRFFYFLVVFFFLSFLFMYGHLVYLMVVQPDVPLVLVISSVVVSCIFIVRALWILQISYMVRQR